MSDTDEFYDQLAPHYHLIYADWRASSLAQGKALDSILAVEIGPGPHRILDCACGIGTQTLGLASLGHQLTGTDLSKASVSRARAEAERLGLLDITFEPLDFFSLGARFKGAFEVVVACDNALPHLTTSEEIRHAASNFMECLIPDGVLLISTRDYDRILPERPSGTLPRRIGEADQERVVFQVWDWQQEDIYTVELFLLIRESRRWEASSTRARYRAWQRADLRELIESAGFVQGRWLEPEETGFFQPLFIARRGPV